jgi:predicted dehydrogenase
MSEKINIAVLGAGRWGPNLVRNFQRHPHSWVSWIVDSDNQKLKLMRERYPDIGTANQAEIVFQDPAVEAVVIATPTQSHFELCHQALTCGKHVFIEKPLATKYDQCLELTALAQEKNRILFVGHVFVYNPSVQFIRRYLHEGHLGKVFYINMIRSNLGPIRNDVNALWDLAPHDISILQYWFDEKPLKVMAYGQSFLGNNLEDVIYANFIYPNDTIVNLHVSWLNPRKIRDIIIVGEKSMLLFDDLNNETPITLYDKHIEVGHLPAIVDNIHDFRASILEGPTTYPKIETREPLLEECSAFIDTLINATPSWSLGTHGAAVVKILQATQASVDMKGREVLI